MKMDLSQIDRGWNWIRITSIEGFWYKWCGTVGGYSYLFSWPFLSLWLHWIEI
jgi:hypothetical protein